MDFSQLAEYSGTSSLDLMDKQSSKELRETENVYIFETLFHQRSPRITELIKRVRLGKSADVFDSLATFNSIKISYIKPELSASAIISENFNHLISDILIDEPLEYPPIPRRTVELKLVYRGELSPILQSDLEYDDTDE